MPATAPSITEDDVERAERTIRSVVRETPVLRNGEVSRRAGAPVTLKAECLQRTGSFKLRGAVNAVAALSREELDAGVVAASAGNHAQALAVAARDAGARADLFMPHRAPLAKVNAVRGHGGEVHLVEGSYEEVAAAALEFATERGATLVPPFDHPEVIAGQGTVGLEIARQAPDTRLVVVPVGGGGLIAGVAIALRAKLPEAHVVGVQAENAAPFPASLAAGQPVEIDAKQTICDGIAVKRPGELTLPLVERYVDEIVTASEDEAAEAMVLMLERAKLVVEGAGAVGVAALVNGRISAPAEGEVCVVLSGGNVDASRLTECIHLGETAAGRRLVILVVVPDRPGALAGLLEIVAAHGANVVDVEHLREGIELHVGETAIQLVLQTAGSEAGRGLVDAIEAEGFRTRVEH